MIYILAPAGGFGNHVSWLIWSNNKEGAFLNPGFMTYNTYNLVKKEHWPEYDKYSKILKLFDQKYKVINKSDILSEFDQHRLFSIGNIDDSLNFIKSNVYSNSRSWHNWILVESQYSERLPGIVIDHTPDIEIEKNNFYIFCQIDENKAYKHYLKLNSSLIKRSKQGFLDYTKNWNKKVLKYQEHPNVLILDNSVLDNDVLDYSYYAKIINFLNLNDNYENANIIHQLWRNCHKTAEQDFLKEVVEVYSR